MSPDKADFDIVTAEIDYFLDLLQLVKSLNDQEWYRDVCEELAELSDILDYMIEYTE